MKPLFLMLSFCVVAACGGDDASDGATDALPIDGPPVMSNVEMVTCPATPAAEITATGVGGAGMFSPESATISVNDVVKFMMPGAHNVIPLSPTTDAGLTVGFGGTKCLQFKAPGTYHFECAPHHFTGMITVN